MINTILPPNGPTCLRTTSGMEQMLVPPTSYHPGGATMLWCDGAVSFISETIDTGNLALGSVSAGNSPYGVWGAMGSKGGAVAEALRLGGHCPMAGGFRGLGGRD